MTEPVCEVLCGDCRELLPTLPRQYELSFADPPFGIGQEYEGFRDVFVDYGAFTKEWVEKLWAATSGVMCLHGNDKLATLYVDVEKELGFRDGRAAWVNWHYRFGQCRRTNWVDARCHCLIYAKRDDHTWRPEEVLVESDRVKYKDKRVAQTARGGRRLPGTVWGVPSDGPYWGRVQGTSAERRVGHPNQLPCVYLERLIKAYTAEGDWVLDPFGGSGVTAAVAYALGRNVTTIEISEKSCDSIRERVTDRAVRVGGRWLDEEGGE